MECREIDMYLSIGPGSVPKSELVWMLIAQFIFLVPSTVISIDIDKVIIVFMLSIKLRCE